MFLFTAQLAGSFVDLDGYFCLILSCGNHSLKELSLKNPKEDRNGLPLYMLQLLALHILNGLEYIHSLNIVHGDLKPSNIFWNGDAGCFFIGDFSHSIVLWEKVNKFNSNSLKLLCLWATVSWLSYTGGQGEPPLNDFPLKRCCPLKNREK